MREKNILKSFIAVLTVLILLNTGTLGRENHKCGDIQNDELQIKEHKITINNDTLDQQQSIEDASFPFFQERRRAQSFTPSLNVLTKIELLIYPHGNPPELTVSICDGLQKNPLSSISKSLEEIENSGDWVTFDFIDIGVFPNVTYYIMPEAVDSTEDNCYYWGAGFDDVYLRGGAYIKSGFGWNKFTHIEFGEVDHCFKTYGRINFYPNEPSITGPTSGTAGEEYSYTFVTQDPENDPVYLWIDWDGGCPADEWVGPFNSGEDVVISNAWNDTGDYTIMAKAKDGYGAESDWSTLKVSMPYKHQTIWELIIDWILQLFGISIP